MSVLSIQSKARLRSLTQVGADGEGIASAETDLGASISRQFRIRAVAVEGFSKGSPAGEDRLILGHEALQRVA